MPLVPPELRKRVVRPAKAPLAAEDLWGAYLSTFALTISNPITILAFLGVFAAVGFSGGSATLPNAVMMIAGVLAGSLCWWLGLCLGAGFFRRYFDDGHLQWINRGSGAILTLSGAALLVSLAVDLWS